MVVTKMGGKNLFEKETITLSDFILFFSYKIDVFLKICIFTVIAVLLFTLFFSNQLYLSDSKIMSSSGNKSSNISTLVNQFGIDLPSQNTTPNWPYQEIIKSRILMKSILKTLFKTKKIKEPTSLLILLTQNIKKNNLSEEEVELIAIDKLLSMLTIKENQGTGTLSIGVSSDDRYLSKAINQSFIKALSDYQREYSKKEIEGSRIFIQERIKETKIELEMMEESLKDFTTRNRRIENSPLLLLEKERIDRDVAILTAVFTTLKQKLETTKIEELRESEYLIVLNPPKVPMSSYKPNLKLRIVLGLIFSVIFSAILCLISEYFRKTNSSSNRKMIESINVLKFYFKNIINFKNKRE